MKTNLTIKTSPDARQHMNISINGDLMNTFGTLSKLVKSRFNSHFLVQVLAILRHWDDFTEDDKEEVFLLIKDAMLFNTVGKLDTSEFKSIEDIIRIFENIEKEDHDE